MNSKGDTGEILVTTLTRVQANEMSELLWLCFCTFVSGGFYGSVCNMQRSAFTTISELWLNWQQKVVKLTITVGSRAVWNREFHMQSFIFFIDGECAWRQKYISIYSMQHIWLCSAWSWTIFTDVWYASHCLLHWTNDKWCSGIDTTKQRAVCCAQVKVVLKLQCKVEVMSSEVGSVCLKPIGLKAMRRIPFEGQECAMLENLWGSQSKV